jgi:hypothetical protein
MRFLIPLAAVTVLAACATASPASAPSPEPTSGSSTVDASRALRLLSAAGAPDAPTRTEIETELGQSDIARQDGAGLALTYRLETCALMLLFTGDDRNEMRLREAHVSARRTGEAAPSLEQCAAEARSRLS